MQVPEGVDPARWDSAIRFLSPAPSAERVHGVRTGYERALDALDHPERKLRCIHIAGTNGKGSTAFAVTQILLRAGYRTGTYCSPFVFDIRERWMVNAAPVDGLSLARAVEKVRSVVENLESAGDLMVTEFERKTLVAFQLFCDIQVDFAVVEVGIGGRLDATNAIAPPLAAAITSIGLDHQNLLGDTRALIAAEKAGILKPGTGFCITPVDDPEAGPVIAAIARDRGVPLCIVDPESSAWESWLPQDLPRYQRSNRVVAAQIAMEMRARGCAAIDDQQIRDGLAAPGLPG
ncbi:MAG: bifunctional folylpolyglutamate synthase/dihydrofolate synthase, partial [Armatimonadaceae bacterium]